MLSIALVVPSSETVVALGSVSDPQLWLTLLGVLLIGSFLYHQIPGSLLLGTVLLSNIFWASTHSYPTSGLVASPLPEGLKLYSSLREGEYLLSKQEWLHLDWIKVAPGTHPPLVHFFTIMLYCPMYSAILSFVFIGLVDVHGVLYGMAVIAGQVTEDGAIRGLESTVSSFVSSVAYHHEPQERLVHALPLLSALSSLLSSEDLL
jgi:xanthine/uracil/vitamin C permease (AzgA family)